jgi:hypothetical protein
MSIFKKLKGWFEKICYPCEGNECECDSSTQDSSPVLEDTVEEKTTQTVETPVEVSPAKKSKNNTGAHKRKQAKKPPKPSKRKKK